MIARLLLALVGTAALVLVMNAPDDVVLVISFACIALAGLAGVSASLYSPARGQQHR